MLEQALIQNDGYPYKKGEFEHTDMDRGKLM